MSSTPARQIRNPPLPAAARPGPQKFATQESMDELITKVDLMMMMLKEVIALQKSAPPSVPAPAVPSLEPLYADVARHAYEACALAIADKKEYEEKDARAVVIGHTECKVPKDGLAIDQKLVSDLIDHSGSAEAKKALADGSVSFHRHPVDRPPSARPLKISFGSKVVRDSFLAGIRSKKGRPPPLVSPASFVRKDLTPHQLMLEREARKDAVQKNLKAGKIVFGVRDYSLITYSTPRDLPPHYGSPRAARPSTRAADRSSAGGHSNLAASSSDLSTARSVSMPSLAIAPDDSNVTKRRPAQPGGTNK